MSPLIENLDKMVSDVPAMPIVAQKVMQMMGDDHVTNTALGETLASDVSMASRILQIANSPFFGTRREITSISNAVFILGHAALRSLIITVCTKGLYKHSGLIEEKLWEHALGSAVCARCLAEKTGFTDPDEAFIGALLHDVGRTILVVNCRDDYMEIFQRFYNEDLSAETIVQMEKEEFGFSHNEIGERVLEKWRLPVVYTRIARRHHTTNVEVLSREEHPQAIAVASMANLFALRLGLGGRAPNRNIDVISNVYNEQFLKLGREDVLKLVETSLIQFNEAKEQLLA